MVCYCDTAHTANAVNLLFSSAATTVPPVLPVCHRKTLRLLICFHQAFVLLPRARTHTNARQVYLLFYFVRLSLCFGRGLVASFSVASAACAAFCGKNLIKCVLQQQSFHCTLENTKIAHTHTIFRLTLLSFALPMQLKPFVLQGQPSCFHHQNVSFNQSLPFH